MRTRLLTTVAALALAAPLASAQQTSLEAGRVEYLSACAGCHGSGGRGDGPLADLMKIETPDLTRLTARAGGEFPWGDAIALIDGRSLVRAHGTDMPVWGDRYTLQAQQEGRSLPGPHASGAPELIVRGRILSLVYYLETLQE